MTDYHSLTCESPCPGWGCDCWCHSCPRHPEQHAWGCSCKCTDDDCWCCCHQEDLFEEGEEP